MTGLKSRGWKAFESRFSNSGSLKNLERLLVNLGEEKYTKHRDKVILEQGCGPVGSMLAQGLRRPEFGPQHCIKLSFIAVTSNRSTWEIETRKLEVQSHPWLWECMGRLSYTRYSKYS